MRRDISSSEQPSELRRLAVMVEAMQRDIKLLLEGHQGLDRRLGRLEQRMDGVEHALLELSTEMRAVKQRLGGVEQRLGGVEQHLGTHLQQAHAT